jgi:hypothetical protein
MIGSLPLDAGAMSPPPAGACLGAGDGPPASGKRVGARPHECFFWGLHSRPEFDLLIVRGNRRVGFEFKLGSAPDLTASMRAAREDLSLERLCVVHGGKDCIRLGADVEAVPLRQLSETKIW